MRRITLAVSYSMFVCGCTNLTSVANFAKSGSDATSGGGVFSSYVEAEQTAVRLAYAPTKHPSQDELSRKEQFAKAAEKAPSLADGNEAALKALSLYLTVLANLSSDKLIDVKDTANSISSSLNSLGAIKSASVGPAGSLIQLLVSAPLDAWRNKEVGNLITNANEPVEAICSGLSTDASAIAVAWGSDVELAQAYYARIPGPANDVRGEVAMSALARQEVAVFLSNQTKATALAQALDKVCQGQKTLFENVGKLDVATVQSNLSGYQTEIDNAAKLIEK